MALKDVKSYYYKMLSQYIESKNDLADFEAALKTCYITEDQLTEAKDDVEQMKNNVDRLAYILYLFELPNRKDKKVLAKKRNENLEEYFSRVEADESAVMDENLSLLTHLRETLRSLENVESK